MPETLKTLEARRSCRSYKPDLIEDDYEGIGHCILGYAATPEGAAHPRKDNYVYYIK